MANLIRTALRDLPPARLLSLGLWTTAQNAAEILLDAGCGEALVLDGDRPLGVVTTRGLARFLARPLAETVQLTVRDVMAPVAMAAEEEPLPPVLGRLLATPSRRLAVVDAKGRAVGLLAPYHVVRAVAVGDELAGATVAQAMGRAVVTAKSDDSVPLVLGRMSRAAVGGVVVVDAADRPVGMFTSRDAVKRLVVGLDLAEALVSGVMHSPAVAIAPQLSLLEAVAGMDGAWGGRLVVTDPRGFLLGVLTWTDVARALFTVLRDAEWTHCQERAQVYQELYDTAPQGLFRLDLNGRPLAVNATLARMLGYPDAARFLRDGADTAHPLRLDLPEHRDLLVAAQSSQRPVTMETRLFRQDGSAALLVCELRAVRDALGAPLHLDGTCVAADDVPVLRQDDYRSLVERQTEFLCLMTPEGRLTLVNAAFARYWGTTPEACIAQRFEPEMPEADRTLVARRLAALTPRRPLVGVTHRVVRAGHQRWQRWTWRGLFDAAGTLTAYQGVGRDVTVRKVAEARLRCQCQVAQALIEAMPVPLYLRDDKGRYRGCNKAFETLLGQPRERFLDREPTALHRAELAAVYLEKDRQLLRHGGRQVYETGVDTATGLRSVLVRKSLYHNGEGRVAGVIGIVLDITDRKQAEVAALQVRTNLEANLARQTGEFREANRRLTAEVAERKRIEARLRRNTVFLETVLNAIQDGICVLSSDMTILKINQAMRAMSTVREGEEGQRCYAFFRGRDVPCENCPAKRALRTGRLAIGVMSKMEGDREVGWVELYCYPLISEDGTVTGVTHIVRDVTGRKKLEAELAEALERAESGSRAKGAFLANMSHEIRTPLNAVLGYVQLMLHDRLEPKQRQRLAIVEESATTLLSLINDVLDYSKIEAGRLNIKAEPFELGQCLEAVIKEQEVLARDKGLTLRLECSPRLPRIVRGDGLRLRQILRNLVNNAVKYTEHGGVTLSVGPEEPQPSDQPAGNVVLRFAVTDTGCGIAEAEQTTIFDSFTRVETGLAQRPSGTGLGLAICRLLAELMGGTVSMRSHPGRGSVFWLTCPFAVVAGATSDTRMATAVSEADRLPPLHFLLVEDNRINRMFVTDLLTSLGHQVDTAENGRQALDFLAEHTVDLVLMDIQMPVMDGLAATRAIRDGSPGIDPKLPVVGLSAYARDEERQRFLAAGLDDYIIKPFDEEAFFTVVRRVLERRAQEQDAEASLGKPLPTAGTNLDRAWLAKQYRGRAHVLYRGAKEFLASAPQQLERLALAVREGDVATCERVAHSLKGNAAMFGAGTLRDVATRTEAAAAMGDTAGLPCLAENLTGVCRSVLADIGVFLERLRS